MTRQSPIIVTPMTIEEMRNHLCTIQATPARVDKLQCFKAINQQIISNVGDDNHYTILSLYNACQMFHETTPTPEKRQCLIDVLNNKPHELDMNVMVNILDSFYST